MPRQANGMTYVDMVFPALLFVMGMSIPLAVGRSTGEGDSSGKIWQYLLGRSFIVNGPQVDQQRGHQRCMVGPSRFCRNRTFLGTADFLC
jgi:Domain of unknown function (DUF5009)